MDKQIKEEEKKKKSKQHVTLSDAASPSGCFMAILLLTVGLSWSARLLSIRLSVAIWIIGGLLAFVLLPGYYLITFIIRKTKKDEGNKNQEINDKK